MVQLRDLYYFFIISTILVLSDAQENYCDICSDHTMCVYNNAKPACYATSSGLRSQQKTDIVTVHNKLRQLVASGNEKRGKPGPQPPAKSMPNLEWDDELASIAQRWANQCKFGHDKCRNVKRFTVGQNVASQMVWSSTGQATSGSLGSLLKNWYNEVQLFNSSQVEHVTDFRKVGHYTQMIWAESTQIGCGFVMYMEGNINIELLICNYGPAGNYIGHKIYEIRH